MGLRTLGRELQQAVAVILGVLVITRVTVDLGQRLQEKSVIRFAFDGFLNFALGARCIARLAVGLGEK